MVMVPWGSVPFSLATLDLQPLPASGEDLRLRQRGLGPGTKPPINGSALRDILALKVHARYLRAITRSRLALPGISTFS